MAGECGPFAPEPYELPMPPHRMNWHAQVLARGARQAWRAPVCAADRHQLGRLRRPARVHLLRLVRLRLPDRSEGDGRATLTSRRAEQAGARVISEAFVHRVNYDAARGRVTGVEYLDAAAPRASRRSHGSSSSRRTRSRTPRLLLLSANATFPDGLANSSGLVGATIS